MYKKKTEVAGDEDDDDDDEINQWNSYVIVSIGSRRYHFASK